MVGRLGDRAECAACVRSYGGSFRGFRFLLDSPSILHLQPSGQCLHRIRETVRLRRAAYPGEMVRACAWCRAFLPLLPPKMAREAQKIQNLNTNKKTSMKKVLIAMAVLLVSVTAAAQDVTTFMGIPIDGTVESVKSKLKAKGFKDIGDNALKGRFFGSEAWVAVFGEKGLANAVFLVIYCSDDEDYAKLSYNMIFDGLKDCGRYVYLKGEKIGKNVNLLRELLEADDNSLSSYFLQNGNEDSPVVVSVEYKKGEYEIHMIYYNEKNRYDINNDL